VTDVLGLGALEEDEPVLVLQAVVVQQIRNTIKTGISLRNMAAVLHEIDSSQDSPDRVAQSGCSFLDCKGRLFWMTGGVLQGDEFRKILKDLVFGEFFPDRCR
jgi:hypothetical protein